MPYTTQEIINIAKVSQYLCANDIAKRGLYGGGVDLELPRKIECVRKNVQWLYNLAPSNSTLTGTGNYLLALCAPYSGEAAVIAGSTSSGSISPIAPEGYAYVSLSFTATADGSGNTPQNGTMAWTNPLFVGAQQVTAIYVDGQMETIVGGAFTFNSTTGTITRTNTWFTGNTVVLSFLQKL